MDLRRITFPNCLTRGEAFQLEIFTCGESGPGPIEGEFAYIFDAYGNRGFSALRMAILFNFQIIFFDRGTSFGLKEITICE